MNEQEDRIDKRGAVSRRFIACTQSTGRVRKSTVAEGLITWMRYADIDFAAVDADSQHLTLSRRYPQDSAKFDATATGAIYLIGMASYAAFAGLVSWLEKLL